MKYATDVKLNSENLLSMLLLSKATLKNLSFTSKSCGSCGFSVKVRQCTKGTKINEKATTKKVN